MIKRNCLLCKRKFLTKNSPSRQNRGKFCSRLCKTTWFRKKHLSTQTEFKPGKKHKFWKGEKAVKYIKGYNSLHRQIREKWGKPSYCEFCKITTSKKFVWANKNGIYNKNPENWLRLCNSCHLKLDLG